MKKRCFLSRTEDPLGAASTIEMVPLLRDLKPFDLESFTR